MFAAVYKKQGKGPAMRRRYSMRFRILVFCVLFGVLLSALIGYNDYHALRTIRQLNFETVRDTTDVQYARLSGQLSSLETYLAGFVYDSADVLTLQSARQDSAWFSALYRLRKDFDASLSVQNIYDFFLYTPAQQQYICTSSGRSYSVRAALAQQIDSGVFFTPENAGRWILLRLDGSLYLIRVLHVYDSYIGAILRADTMLDNLSGGGERTLYFDLADANGVLQCADGGGALPSYTADTADRYVTTSWQGQPQMLITRALPHSSLSLVVMMPDRTLAATAHIYGSVMWAILACVAAVLCAAFFVLRRWVMQPVAAMTEAIRRLRGGDLDACVAQPASCTEFDEMNDTFNSMVREIHTLKIDIYEEQLQRQETEIEYLQLQVTPHFLVNCLNTVYQLTDAGEPELTKRMVRDLSRHLRYLLSSGSSVALSEETALVENFIELSAIRYPGCLRLKTDYDPQAADAAVIPLLILNFVENTVKYEAGMGRITEVHVSTRLESGEAPRVRICIWDTGRGFGREMLDSLADIDSFITLHKNAHIGIANVFLRARLILGKDCEFRFSNRPDAGAQIDISIPYKHFQKPEAAQ